MPRCVWLFLIGLTAATLVAGGGHGAVPTAGWPAIVESGHASLPDPFPLRRLRVTEAQLADLRKPGEPLMRMARAEFEKRVRTAAEAVRDRGTPVTLLEARYSASMVDNDLAGSATWIFENPNTQATAFALEPMRCAISAARWAEGPPAVLGSLGPGFAVGPSLWVPAGRQVLTLEWSAMGTAEPGERRFELRVPPTLSSSLELDLPADRVAVSTGRDVLLTGAFTAKTENRRLWRFRFSAASRFEIAVRAAANSPTARDPVRASLVARYDLDATQTRCSFEYDLDPVRGSVTEWLFDVDPGVRILDAIATDRAGWLIEPGTPGAPSLLRVRLRQTGSGGKVLITAMAPPVDAANADLPLPMIRPRNGRVGEEHLTVRFAPDLKPAGWNAGDYRVLGMTTEADRSLSLAFAGSLVPVSNTRAFRRPPGIAATGASAVFDTREALEWRVESGRAILDASVRIRVRRGALFTLPIQLATGYTLFRASSVPEDAVALAAPVAGTPGTILVEFQKPVLEGHDVDLHLEFRGPVIPATARPLLPAKLPLPRVAPQGAAERQGAFAVLTSPGWQVSVRAPGVAAATDQATISYRGTDPEGALFVAPWAPDWSASSRTVLSRVDGQLTATTRETIRVPTGSVASVTMLVPEMDTGERTWQLLSPENSLASVQPVPLANLNAWLPMFAPLSGGWNRLLVAPQHPDVPLTAWRLTFAQPVGTELVLESSIPLKAIDDEVAVPLLTLADCPTQGGSTTLDASVAREYRLETQGQDASMVRDLRAPTRLHLHRLAVSSVLGSWGFHSLQQVSRVEGAGDVRVSFGGRIRSSGGPVLDIQLPRGAMVESAFVAGHWLSPHSAALAEEPDGPTLHLPVPSAIDVPFEVHYRLPPSLRFGVGRIVSPQPRLPGNPDECERAWVLGANVAALGSLQGKAIGSERPLEFLKQGTHGSDTVTIPAVSNSLLAAHSSVLAAARFFASAAILALGWWLARRSTRPSPRLLLVAFLVFALGSSAEVVVGVSHFRWPVLAAAAALAMLLIARGRKPSTSLMDATATPGALLALLVTLAVSTTTSAQPVEPSDVYLLPGDEVLVSQTILDRLEKLSRPMRPTVVITAAKYEGKSENGLARVTASFTVENLSNEPAPLTLPLGDARLEDVRIGGEKAFPLVTSPEVYRVTIPASGSHTVITTFTVPVKKTGADREVRLGIPEVPMSRLTWAASAEGRQLTSIGWRGQQHSAGSQLSVDLGTSRQVQLRWREGPSLGTMAAISARQACVWSIDENEAELTAVFLFSVSQGSSNSFRFEVPLEIDLTRVAVRSLDPGTSVVLRDWTVSPERDGVRSVRVQLQSPLEGRALVILEGVPRSPLSSRPVLRFPRAFGTTIESQIFGLRTDRVNVVNLLHPGLELSQSESLTKDFPGVADLQFSGSAPKLFRPLAAPAPEFRATLQPPSRSTAGSASASQTIVWTVTASRRADGVGSLRWAAKPEPTSVVEFDLPAVVKVQEVRAPELQGWTVNAVGRVQAWFKSPQSEPSLEWVGTLSLSPAAKGLDPLPFEPPVAKLGGSALVTTTVEVQPPEGWGWRVERDRGWAAVPTPGRALSYHSEAPLPVPLWSFFTPRANAPAAVGFGRVEIGAEGVVYRVHHVHPLLRARPAHLVLRVSRLTSGASVEPTAPEGVHITPLTTTGPIREWDLDVPAGTGEALRTEVLVRLPMLKGEAELPGIVLEMAGGPPIPAVGVNWLGLVEPPNAKWRLRGAAPSPTRWDAVKAEWPKEIDDLRKRDGTLWAPRSPSAILRLDPMGRDPVSSMAAANGDSAKASVPAMEPSILDSAPPDPEAPTRLLPLAAWWIGFALLLLLALRFPRSTWPEQLGLLAALVLLFLGEPPVAAIAVPVALRIGLRVLRRYSTLLHAA